MIDLPHRFRIVWRVAVVRWYVLVREPGALFWAFVFPILLTIALGVAFRSRAVPPSAVVVVASPAAPGEKSVNGVLVFDANDVAKALAGTPDLRVDVEDEGAARRALRNGAADVAIVPGWPLSFRVDPTRTEGLLAEARAKHRLEVAFGEAPPERPDTTTTAVTETGSRYVDFLVPGLLGMTLMSSGLWGIGYVVVDMRAKKLLRRLVATPLRGGELLASFLVVRAWGLLLEIPPLLVAGSVLFGTRVTGSFVAFLAVAALGAAAFASLSLLLASRASNSHVISGLINLVSMPMLVASGVFFSTSRFPSAAQPFLRALPLTALNDALRRIANDGGGFAAVAPEIGVLAAWSVASFALAIPLFRYE